MASIELEYTSSKEATKCITELLRNVQRSDTLSELSLVIPR